MKTYNHECVVAIECCGDSEKERTWKQIDADIKSQVECYDDIGADDYAMLDLCPYCGIALDVMGNRKELTQKLKVFK